MGHHAASRPKLALLALAALPALLLLAIGVGAAGCSSERVTPSHSAHGTAQAADAAAPSSLGGETETQEQPPAETKPSEGSEGVPGYMVDPSLVVLQSDPATQVTAGAGSVATDAGLPGDVVVSIWQIQPEAIAKLVTNPGHMSIDAKLLATVRAGADGSIAVPLAFERSGFLIASSDRQLDPARLVIEALSDGKVNTAIKDAASDGPFLELNAFLGTIVPDVVEKAADALTDKLGGGGGDGHHKDGGRRHH